MRLPRTLITFSEMLDPDSAATTDDPLLNALQHLLECGAQTLEVGFWSDKHDVDHRAIRSRNCHQLVPFLLCRAIGSWEFRSRLQMHRPAVDAGNLDIRRIVNGSR